MIHLWTLHIKGGKPHVYQTHTGRRYEHDGRLSVWHILCDESRLQAFVLALESGGCMVTAHDEYPSYRQKQIRDARFNLQQETFVYPTASCPKCFFFSPEEDVPCGRVSWEKDYVQSCLKNQAKARLDLIACPIGE